MTQEQALKILGEYNIDLNNNYDSLPRHLNFVGDDEMNASRIHSIKQPMSGLRETYCNSLDALIDKDESPLITIYSYEPIFSFSIKDNGSGMDKKELVNNLLSFKSSNQNISNTGTFSQGFKQSLSFSSMTYVESIKNRKKSWTLIFPIKWTPRKIGSTYCYLDIKTENTDEKNGTFIKYLDYDRILELKNTIVTGDISTSYQFLSEYFFKGKDIKINDKRLKGDRQQNIHPLFSELSNNGLGKVEMKGKNYDIVIFYASNSGQLDKLKKHANFSELTKIHYYLNNVYLTNSFDENIVKELPYITGYVYISVLIKNNHVFFNNIITSNREELKENENVNQFKENLRHQIINNDELKVLNSKKENEGDAKANTSLTDMLNTLIRENNDKQLYSNTSDNGEDKPNARECLPNDEKNEPVGMDLDVELKRISIPKNKTVYEKKENFYLKTYVDKNLNDKIAPFMKFLYDEEKQIDISFIESKDGKIKYSIEFTNDYDNVELKVVYSKDESIKCKGTFLKRNLSFQQKIIKKIKGAINIVKTGNVPISVDLETDTMRFDVNKNFEFDDPYYNNLWKQIHTDDTKKNFLTNICFWIYLKKTNDDKYFDHSNLPFEIIETCLIMKACCLPSKVFAYAI